jgi:hypothetical protein
MMEVTGCNDTHDKYQLEQLMIDSSMSMTLTRLGPNYKTSPTYSIWLPGRSLGENRRTTCDKK